MACCEKEMKVIALIIVLGIVLRASVLFFAPIWAGPDEPAHYAYLQHIAQKGEIPFAANNEEASAGLLNVTGQNPPLYHIIGASFYLISDSVYWIRMESLIFGILCIMLSFLVAAEITRNRFIRLGTAMFIALLPTHIVLSATINNETMLYALVLASIFFMLKCANKNFDFRNFALAGIFFGLAFATRFNAAILGLPYLLLMTRYFRKEISLKRITALVPPVVIAAIALGANLLAYGSFFPFRETHPATLDFGIFTYFIPRVFAGIWLQEYGIAAIPDYRAIIFFLLGLVSLAGIILAAIKVATGFGKWTNEKIILVGIPVLAIIGNVILFAIQNTVYFEPDGRLLYPTVSLWAIFIFFGLSRLEEKKRIVLAGLLFGLMAILAMLLIANHYTVLPPVPWPLP